LVLSVNLAATFGYGQFLRDRDTEYSYFYTVPLSQRQAIVELIAARAEGSGYDVALVTWSWSNHMPYAYLFGLEPHRPQSMFLFESASGEAGPYTLYSLDVSRFLGMESREVDEEVDRHFIVKEPDTLPMPSYFEQAVFIDRLGGAGIYQISE